MSDIRPVGVSVMVEGVERHFLFTLNAIDELQDIYDKSIEEIIDDLTDKRAAAGTMKQVVTTLLNDEAERKLEAGYKEYTKKEIGSLISQDNIIDYTIAVLKAYGLSLPELNEEDDYPNEESGNMSESM